MKDSPYRIEEFWEGSADRRIFTARAVDKDGIVINSLSCGVTLDGIDLPGYYRQKGHLPDIDIENLVREELHKKLNNGDAKSSG